jgi:hypothetical protein
MDNLHCLTVPRQRSGLALTTITAVAAVVMAATLLLAG